MTAKTRVLDSYAILALLQGEAGAAHVERVLRSAADGDRVAMSEINAGEVFYLLRKRLDRPRADALWGAFLALGLDLVPVDFDLVLDAARVKATRPMSYADCFAVATAQRLDARVVTGDPEFEHAEDLVVVEWLP